MIKKSGGDYNQFWWFKRSQGAGTTAPEIYFAFTQGHKCDIYSNSLKVVIVVSSLPRAAGEPPRAIALRGLT
ncbi:hypothetical protein GCM10008986_15670 [Salinibacillus aidingensis]|uniref:Uncharacterized protein n=1 Tax=Salinibacillus aidingensis TaxID=237684 RepID=A0ABP3L0E6_9BACI